MTQKPPTTKKLSTTEKLSAAEQSALREAARWYALLCSGTASATEHQAWQAWLESAPLNAQAWARIERVQAQMARVPKQLAAPTLQGGLRSRRHILRGFILLTSVGSVAWLSKETDWAQALTADYRTTIGERQKLTLADGSLVWLNTQTALDVRYDPQQRLIALHQGEILVETSPDRLERPFWVSTAYGRVQALGTSFTLRIDEEGGHVAVLDKAVNIHLYAAYNQPMRVQKGQQISFSQEAFHTAAPTTYNTLDAAWRQGSLIVMDQPLAKVIEELARYRWGWLRCDPAVAQLKVSGTYPLDNTDLALAALASGLPIRIERRTAYWVTVTAENNSY